MRAFVGLGSNQGDGPSAIRDALVALRRNRNILLTRVSSLYRTKPWGLETQADFTNAVAELETDLPPIELLELLLSTEEKLGRVRTGARWGPRTIDLDLLSAGEACVHLPGLELPHPRMHERAFVLVPLLELVPDFLIPGIGSAQDWLDKLDKSEVERLP